MTADDAAEPDDRDDDVPAVPAAPRPKFTSPTQQVLSNIASQSTLIRNTLSGIARQYSTEIQAVMSSVTPKIQPVRLALPDLNPSTRLFRESFPTIARSYTVEFRDVFSTAAQQYNESISGMLPEVGVQSRLIRESLSDLTSQRISVFEATAIQVSMAQIAPIQHELTRITRTYATMLREGLPASDLGKAALLIDAVDELSDEELSVITEGISRISLSQTEGELEGFTLEVMESITDAGIDLTDLNGGAPSPENLIFAAEVANEILSKIQEGASSESSNPSSGSSFKVSAVVGVVLLVELSILMEIGFPGVAGTLSDILGWPLGLFSFVALLWEWRKKS